MSIPRFSSMFFVGLALSVLLSTASVAQSQKQASCTFSFFSLTTNIPNIGRVHVYPSGINDFGTVVGWVDNAIPPAAFIRWANGGFSFPLGTSSGNVLIDRNDSGTSLGGSAVAGTMLLNGTSITPIALDINNGGFLVNRINKWNSIVGVYSSPDHSLEHGFKRWSNGSVLTLDDPGGYPTTPNGINDSGTVVGEYVVNGLANGFIYHNGQWATLTYPNSVGTNLVGITNAGVIIGNFANGFSGKAFLYQNGIFKVISVPQASVTRVLSISLRSGLILGTAGFSTGYNTGFIAKCK